MYFTQAGAVHYKSGLGHRSVAYQSAGLATVVVAVAIAVIVAVAVSIAVSVAVAVAVALRYV